MNSPKPSVIPGEIVDTKYRVDGLIGAGGMGSVYEATQTAIRRKVAIKLLHANFAENPDVVRRFQQEAEIAGSLGHDNICEVTDLGTLASGAPYLVMPLLKGLSLAELLIAEQPLSVFRVSDIICQTLSALESAHGAGIVHRDLKPDNIFVTKLGDRDDFVKLLDFGISKMLGQDSVVELTRTGTVLGTPFYMSPEQARGDKVVDERTDIYAIGVILYQALTGKRPFEGTSYNQVLAKIFTDPFPLPRTLSPSISKAIEQVILKAMDRNPNERYSTATAMRQALEEATEIAATDPADTALHTDIGTGLAGSSPYIPEPIEPSVRTDEGARKALAPPVSARKKMVIGLIALGLILLVIGILAATGRRQETVLHPNVPLSISPANRAMATPAPKDPPMASPPQKVEAQVAAPEEKPGTPERVQAEAPQEDSAPKRATRPPKSASKGKPASETPREPLSPVEETALKKPSLNTLEGRSGTHIITDYK